MASLEQVYIACIPPGLCSSMLYGIWSTVGAEEYGVIFVFSSANGSLLSHRALFLHGSL